jgi:hypothetical protein
MAMPVDAQWAAARTPWGDPDIQGVFTTDDELGVPFERPPQFGSRAVATEEEYNSASPRRMPSSSSPSGRRGRARMARARRDIGWSAAARRGALRSSSTRLTAASRS